MLTFCGEQTTALLMTAIINNNNINSHIAHVNPQTLSQTFTLLSTSFKMWIQIMSFKQNWTSVERCFHSGHMLHDSTLCCTSWRKMVFLTCPAVFTSTAATLCLFLTSKLIWTHSERVGTINLFPQRGISSQTNCCTWDYGTAMRNTMMG